MGKEEAPKEIKLMSPEAENARTERAARIERESAKLTKELDDIYVRISEDFNLRMK